MNITGQNTGGEQGLSIIVPVYNEADGILPFLKKLEEIIHTLPLRTEVLIIDDGSTDTTPALLGEQSFTVIRHEWNRGYGAAIKTGIQHCNYEAILIIDADGTYVPEDIPKLLHHFDGCDMAVGARTSQDAKIPISRRPAKWLIRQFTAWIVRQPIPDLNSGLRLFRKSQVEPILRLLPDGFSLTTTITVAFITSGKRVHYEEIQYNKRMGQSKFHPLSDTWNMILLILRTVVLIRPLNVFVPFSFLLAIFAFMVLIISKLMGHFMDATFIVLMMASIQMFVLGLIADLIVRINLWTH